MEEAKLRIDGALELLNDLKQDDCPQPSVRAIHSYLSEARLAAMNDNSRNTVIALDLALLLRDQELPPEGE